MSEEMERKLKKSTFYLSELDLRLSGAIRLRNQIDDHNDALEAEGKEPLNARIMILEKEVTLEHMESQVRFWTRERSVNCSMERR